MSVNVANKAIGVWGGGKGALVLKIKVNNRVTFRLDFGHDLLENDRLAGTADAGDDLNKVGIVEIS